MSCLLFSVINLFFIQVNAQSMYDPEFGNDGVYVQGNINFGGTDNIAFQGSDKILLGSYFQIGFDSNYSISRINLDGTLDANFANNGVYTNSLSPSYNFLGSMVVDDDGSIYIVSSADINSDGKYHMTITKLTQNGVLDITFGTDGYATLSLPTGGEVTEGLDIKTTSNGDIIVGGLMPLTDGGESIIVAKYSSNGTLDANFGSGGSYIHPPTSSTGQRFHGILINSDDSINIIGGLVNLTNYNENATVLKLTPNGIIDANFGANGSYTDNYTDGSRGATRGTLLDDESILLYGIQREDGTNNYQGWSSRINSAGSLDTTYGTAGYGDSFYGGADIVVNYSQMIPKGNYYVLIGDIFDLVPFTRNIIITRLHSNGTFDTTYGNNGTSLFNPTSNNIISTRGRNAISRGGDFYIASEIETSTLNTSSIVKLVDESLSINESVIDNNKILLYPNPVNNTTLLQYTSMEVKTGILSIVNVSGQQLKTRNIDIEPGVNNFELVQDLEVLSNGVYFIHIISDGAKTESIKFIKQ
ncbi:T9SS type A sorting domain-containing protein [Winogradskyella sp.]|uniref:T9SS type A sorting domain-containing protein n=1 Tax=Winogradskyella sp. TaxID=1883156 RepID=UPI003AB4E7C8